MSNLFATNCDNVRGEIFMAKGKVCVDHLGNSFDSIEAMCNYHKVSRAVFYSRIRRGMSLEEALTSTKSSDKSKLEVTDHLGIKHESFEAMCKFYSKSCMLVTDRLRKGKSLGEALTTPVGERTPSHNKNARECKDHLGNIYESVADLCEAYGISKATYYNRQRLGWDLERILTEKSNKKTIKKGVEDLASQYPLVARDWDYSLNGDLSPTDVKPTSKVKVNWCCENGHKWAAPVYRRVREGCPECAKNRFSSQFNGGGFNWSPFGSPSSLSGMGGNGFFGDYKGVKFDGSPIGGFSINSEKDKTSKTTKDFSKDIHDLLMDMETEEDLLAGQKLIDSWDVLSRYLCLMDMQTPGDMERAKKMIILLSSSEGYVEDTYKYLRAMGLNLDSLEE